MSTQRSAFAAVAFTLVLGAGCGPVVITDIGAGGGGGGGGGPAGGTVSLGLSSSSGFDFAFASASFIKDITGDTGGSGGGGSTGPGIDECVKPDTGGGGGAGGNVEITWHDVGDTVTLSGGDADIELTKSDASGVISYIPTGGTVAATDVSAGTAYDVALSGSPDVEGQTWSGSLSLPGEINVTSPDLSAAVSVTAGTDLDLEWDPAGVSEVAIIFGGLTLYTCRATDDGSFAIPAAVVDDVDASGTIGITAVSTAFQDFTGRSVVMSGTTGVSGTYTK